VVDRFEPLASERSARTAAKDVPGGAGLTSTNRSPSRSKVSRPPVDPGHEHPRFAVDISPGGHLAGLERARRARQLRHCQRLDGDLDHQHASVAECVESHGNRVAVEADAHDPFLCGEATVDLPVEEERWVVDVVVTGVRVAAVVSIEPSVAAQDPT